MLETQAETLQAVAAGADTRAKLAAALKIPRSSCNSRVARLLEAGELRESFPFAAARKKTLKVAR